MAFSTACYILMTIWKRGRELLKERRDRGGIPLADCVANMSRSDIPTIAGTAVFLTPNPDQAPHALLHSLKHYESLHEWVVILNVGFTDEPFVAMADRIRIERMSERFYRAEARFGFMDHPDLSETLHVCADQKMPCEPEDTTFFLGRETLIPKRGREIAFWRQKLFIAQSRNAGSPAAYFNLPANRVVELGAQIVL